MVNFASRFNPVTRILWLLGCLLLLIIFNDPLYLSGVFVCVTLLSVFACRPGGRIIKAMPLMVAFSAASLVLWPPFVQSGERLFSIGPYAVTTTGALFAASMALRINGTVVVAIGFASSILPEEFAAGLRAIKVPPAVGFAVSLAFRLLPVVAESTSRVVESQKARGVSFSGGPLRRIKQYVPIIVPVILLNLRGADQMAVALELRGFAPSRVPVPHNPPARKPKDLIAGLLIIVLVVGAFALRIAGYGAIIPERI